MKEQRDKCCHYLCTAHKLNNQAFSHGVSTILPYRDTFRWVGKYGQVAYLITNQL